MMKSKSKELKEITQRLKAFNRQMSKSDNDRVYGKIREVRESHDRFWQILKEGRDKIRREKDRTSNKHRDHLMTELDLIQYNEWADKTWSTLTAGAGKVDKEDMKWRASRLKELSQEFSSVKNEMFRDHKSEVFNKIQKVRASHDVFWGRYREYTQARQSQFREKVEANLEKNQAKLSKAKDALYRFKNKRDDLQSKIYDSNSENWKAKAYGWLSEFEDKIHDIESSIDKLESWIEEDRQKLSR